jgi:hypothetical protein
VSLDRLHLEDLRKSGLTDEIIALMACRSVPPKQIGKLQSGGLPGVESVLEFPYPPLSGGASFSRFKLFPPFKPTDSHSIKYVQLKDSGCHLYILPPVSEKLADLSEPLFIVEGEKKAAAAVQAGLNAVGVGGIWNWKDKDTWKGIEELQAIGFADRDTGLVFDSDTWTRDDLQRAVYALGKYLEFRGARVFVYLIPQPTRAKVGLDDYLLTHTIQDFKELKKITLKHPALAQYRQWYDDWKAKNEGETVDDLQGKPLLLREVTPHNEAVEGAELLLELCQAIRRYVVAENADIVAIALWCVHAHAIDAFGISPFLNLSSPEKGCGKSTTLTVISYLLPRPLLSASVSPASIFRTIELFKPSFLIDEADSFDNLNEDLRGLLNASHLRASAQAIRVVGDQHEPRTFSTWCPKAISLIGHLPATLEDRSIVIDMRRRKREEACERFSAIDPHPELELLGQKVARWVKDSLQTLRQAKPVAEGVDLRLYDNWMPLLAVADLAGGRWPDWVRIAARRFVAKAADSASVKVELLMDMAEVMNGQDRVTSEDLVNALNQMADRPWPTWNKSGKPITQIQVSRMVKGFDVKPTKYRTGDKTVRGYHKAEVVAAQSRYAPATDPEHPEQKINENEISELEAIFVPGRVGTEKEASGGRAGTKGNGHDDSGFNWTTGEQEDKEPATKTGITVADVLQEFPGSKVVNGADEADTHGTCKRCGQKIVERVWGDGRRDFGCHGCGRKA